MSTKKTRSALAMLGTIAGGSDIMRQAIHDAMKEVEAIERAAKAVWNNERAMQEIDGDEETFVTIRSIAKDAP